MKRNHPIKAAVLALISSLVICSPFAGVVLAKGPVLAQPPITIGIFMPPGIPEALSQSQATSLGSVIVSIPHLYNSSWKPAVQNLAAFVSKSTKGVWLDYIRLEQGKPLGNGTSTLTVSFGAIVNGSDLKIASNSYPGDQGLAKDLKVLNASMYVVFSVFGPDFTPTSIGELFLQTDSYFHGFSSVTSQVSQMVATQATGEYFGWLSISLLDGTTARLDSDTRIPTTYFGPAMRADLLTQTATSPGSKSNPGGVISPWSYAIGGLGIIALGGALTIVIISRRKAVRTTTTT